MKTNRLGVAYGVGAYVIWGSLPIYWRWLDRATAYEILANRGIWSLMVCLIFLAFQKQLPTIYFSPSKFNAYEIFIDFLKDEKSAEKIYQEASEKINSTAYSTRNLLRKVKAEFVCTTEDPIDNLEYHQQLVKSNFEIKVSTAFRPDKAILIGNDGYNDYVNTLGNVTGVEINSYDDLCDALLKRIQFFNDNGCKISDHGLEQMYYENHTEAEIKAIFKKKRD